MHYQTRHLEALADFNHGQTQVRKGDRFPVSEIDAKFYVDRGRAKDVTDEVATAKPAEKPAPAAAKTASHAPAVKRAAHASAGHRVTPMTAAETRGEATPSADAKASEGDASAADGKA